MNPLEELANLQLALRMMQKLLQAKHNLYQKNPTPTRYARYQACLSACSAIQAEMKFYQTEAKRELK